MHLNHLKTLNLPTKATSNTWKKNKLKQRHPDRLRRLCTPSASTEPSAPALAPLASTCSFSAGLDWLISTWRCRNRRRFCVWENHGRFREIRSKNRKVERIVEIIWIRYSHNGFFLPNMRQKVLTKHALPNVILRLDRLAHVFVW